MEHDELWQQIWALDKENARLRKVLAAVTDRIAALEKLVAPDLRLASLPSPVTYTHSIAQNS